MPDGNYCRQKIRHIALQGGEKMEQGQCHLTKSIGLPVVNRLRNEKLVRVDKSYCFDQKGENLTYYQTDD